LSDTPLLNIAKADVTRVYEATQNNEIKDQPGKYIAYEEYAENGRYSLLQECHNTNHTSEDIIKILKDSNLRDLGEAGFPTDLKWKILRKQLKPRLIAVNIDEGEPGTFKDRFYLESDPLIVSWKGY